MEESAVCAPVEQEEIRADIGALFRGAIRVTLECLREQEVREMEAHAISRPSLRQSVAPRCYRPKVRPTPITTRSARERRGSSRSWPPAASRMSPSTRYSAVPFQT